ncbi:MAG: TMEM165/GDT1 family protein [Xanthomonadaceae bacterium]|nr:TMEM165/GDT1 family protein [Xanthomonadaceae bacterium]
MDWKIFASTFITILFAEMGDKTQFAAMGMSTVNTSTVSIWLGVVLGLAVAGTVGVLAGKLLGNTLPPITLKWISGSLFILMGAWTLIRN